MGLATGQIAPLPPSYIFFSDRPGLTIMQDVDLEKNGYRTAEIMDQDAWKCTKLILHMP